MGGVRGAVYANSLGADAIAGDVEVFDRCDNIWFKTVDGFCNPVKMPDGAMDLPV